MSVPFFQAGDSIMLKPSQCLEQIKFMRKNHLRGLVERHSGKFVYLLLSLLFLMILIPMLYPYPLGQIALNVLLIITMLLSLYTISQKRKLVIGALLIAVLTFITMVYSHLTRSSPVAFASLCLGFAFFMFTTVTILIQIFKEEEVTVDEIAAAISTYLLIGMSGAFLFGIIDYLIPGSIVSTTPVAPILSMHGGDLPYFADYIYFSFTSLTTLGFGDLVPASPIARTFSYLEAVIGQIYLTVLVARLVGLHISRQRN